MIVTCGAQRFVGVGLLRDQKANAHLACRRGVAAPLGGKRFCPVWTPLYGLNAEGTRVAVRTQSTITNCQQGYWWSSSGGTEGKLIIAARYEEDVSWMANHLLGQIPFIVYNTKDISAKHYTSVHNGNEAAAYLQFIVDYYECLPHRMAFIHAHQRDMKVAPDYAMDEDLQLLHWDTAGGFASLNRSKLLWHIIFSHNRHRTDQTDYHKQVARSITIAWDELLAKELGQLPDELHVNGGGQFIVQRDRVLHRSKEFYQECLTWLADSLTLSPWDKGMVFEYTWKVIFGEPSSSLDKNVWDTALLPQ